MEVVEMADFVASTNGMLDVIANSDAKEFLIATEEGMLERLRREFPDRKFYALMGVCTHMKKITLENTYQTLLEEKNVIEIDNKIAEKASLTLERMLEVS
jgi:quinolinate synthase